LRANVGNHDGIHNKGSKVMQRYPLGPGRYRASSSVNSILMEFEKEPIGPDQSAGHYSID